MQIPQLQQWEMFAITGKIWSCITRMPKTKLHLLRRWKLMQIKRYSDGSMKLYIDDEDKYDVTDDNGVDVWLTKEQVRRIRENPWPLKPSPTAPSVPASKSAMHISQEAFTGIRKVWIHAKGPCGRAQDEAWDRTAARRRHSCFDVVLVMKWCLVWRIMITRHKYGICIYIFTWKFMLHI